MFLRFTAEAEAKIATKSPFFNGGGVLMVFEIFIFAQLLQDSDFMTNPKRHLITAALPYANGPLHIGHIAGGYLSADIYARFLRLKGKEVAFICGSDEHGAAITIKALKENTTAQAIVDEYHSINKKAFEEFGISFDIYHRTSSELHHQTAKEFFKDLHANGKFTQQTSEQYYDELHKQFLADRYIKGTCPKCGHEDAYGDQCEKCGSTLSPLELKNPKSTLSDSTPTLKSTTHHYFPLDQYEEWLKEWILKDKKHWKSNVYGQCKSWIDAGLKPRAMTRDLSWGVEVPVAGAEGKVMYVWLDAPIGYISATKQWAKDNSKDWKDFWQSKDTELVHFLGKDNIVFHCIIFPSLLHAHSENYVLPTNVPANEFLNLEGDKISTSRNHAVWLHEYLEDFKGKTDELRYVLCSIAPEQKDSEFTWADFAARINNELVAVLGNFVNRTIVLTGKYYGGSVPQSNNFDDTAKEVLQQLSDLKQQVEQQITAFRFRDALQAFMQMARLGNKYLADLEPWKLQKTNPEAVEPIMALANIITASLAIVAAPFLPVMSQKLKAAYGLQADFKEACREELLEKLKKVDNPGLLFEKIEQEQVTAQIEKLNARKPTSKHMAQKQEISFDDFTKLDIRTAEILEAKKVEKADKLLELKVDTGLDQRTVVSGIAEHFKPEDIVGKKVSVLLNLAPRKIRGIESQGMILMAEDESGLHFVSPKNNTENGSIVS